MNLSSIFIQYFPTIIWMLACLFIAVVCSKIYFMVRDQHSAVHEFLFGKHPLVLSEPVDFYSGEDRRSCGAESSINYDYAIGQELALKKQIDPKEILFRKFDVDPTIHHNFMIDRRRIWNKSMGQFFDIAILRIVPRQTSRQQTCFYAEQVLNLMLSGDKFYAMAAYQNLAKLQEFIDSQSPGFLKNASLLVSVAARTERDKNEKD